MIATAPLSLLPATRRIVDGYEIAVRHRPACAAGSGTTPRTVALVHGMADSSNSWTSVAAMLPDCDLWLFDMPWSGAEGARWAAERRPADWCSAARALCPATIDVAVGHSFAATTLAEWSLTAPRAEAAAALVLLSPVFVDDAALIDWDMIDAFARSVPGQLEAAVTERVERPLSPAVRRAMAAKLAGGLLPGGMLALFAMLERLAARDLRSLGATTRLLVGERDTAFASAGAAALARRCGTPLTRIDGCGHVPMHRFAAVIAEAVRSPVDRRIAA